MKSVSQTNCEENTIILNQNEQYMMQLLSHWRQLKSILNMYQPNILDAYLRPVLPNMSTTRHIFHQMFCSVSILGRKRRYRIYLKRKLIGRGENKEIYKKKKKKKKKKKNYQDFIPLIDLFKFFIEWDSTFNDPWNRMLV